MKRVIKWRLLILIILGLIVAFILREILFSKLVPDICVYHNGKEPGFIIGTFYHLPSWNGSHPAPNLLNQVLTGTIGGIVGLIIYFLIKKIEHLANS